MRRILALIALATTWSASPATAQLPSGPTTILLRPAAAPSPALKYRLVPERPGQVPGNAAIFYHRALLVASTHRADLDAERKFGPPAVKAETTDDRVSGWIEGPIADLPRDQARALLARFQTPLHEVELAATRTTCDWEFDARPEGISLLLPEIQAMRSLARLVALKARLATLDGRTDEAIRAIEDGLVMGRNVARGPTLIQDLVGIAIDNIMLGCLEELIQAPGTPSLYWALADRPRPFITMRESLEWERNLLEKELPGLLDLDKEPWGIARARKFSEELEEKLALFRNEGSTPLGPLGRLGLAAMTAKIYPEARRALIAGGRPEAEVDAMPVVQVACLDAYRQYRRHLDESSKWFHMPPWQSAGKLDAALGMTGEQKRANPLLAMFRGLTPSLSGVLHAEVRLERHLDALQCIEAIRLHADGHGGALPQSLDALADAPAPLDPATGKPFDYKVEGDSATLSAPLPPGAPDHPSYQIRYVLKPAR